MTLHFIHIGKTGGSAIKRALRGSKLAYWREEDRHTVPETPYGRIQLHNHRFRFEHLAEDDYTFFFLRDPVPRFLSGFYSRLNKGQPRYTFEWSPAEQAAFEAFPSPLELAHALASDSGEERELAQQAMRSIQHLRFQKRHVGSPKQLRARLGQVVYIGRQETLGADWEQLKSLLQLPQDVELPSDPVRAHRRDKSSDAALDEAAEQALREWYAPDLELIEFCDKVRAKRGWGGASGADSKPSRLLRALRR